MGRIKKDSQLTRDVLWPLSYETDEYFVRFRANAQNPLLLSSHFFFIRGHEMVLLKPNE